MKIEMENIVKIHVEKKKYFVIFNKVNYTFYPGDLYYIYDPGHSGKTTLLNLLCLQTKYDEGTLCIGGKSIAHLFPHEKNKLKRKIAYVQENSILYPKLSIRENILLPLHVHLLETQQKEERVNEYLMEYGLIDKADFYPKSLSEEERQIVCLIRAFVQKPDILLLDEPFAKLSESVVEKVMEKLCIMQNSGHVIIIASKRDRKLNNYQTKLIIKDRNLVEENA